MICERCYDKMSQRYDFEKQQLLNEYRCDNCGFEK